MKKWLKIWMLTMAFLAAMTTVISTGKVEAQAADPDTSNYVRVSINAYNNWQNDCSGTNYIFNFTGSTQEQTDSKTGTITCVLGNKTWQAITLQLSWDLTAEWVDLPIPRGNISFTNGTWTRVPEDLGTAWEPWTSAFGDTPKTLFNKAGNKIWDASGTNLTIEVKVPAWQPDGTYQGTLVLTF